MVLKEKISVYKFHAINSLSEANIAFGCGIQINTPESRFEILPFYDNESNLCITADAIIDNRDELIKLLQISSVKGEVLTDSQIILAAYKTWGKECPKHLIGDFAFAIWDPMGENIFCARDQVGKRSLYYYNSSNEFIFCTTINPILEILDEKVDLNEAWISDFLTIEGVIHEINIHETVYKNVFQVPPGHYIHCNKLKINVQKYWFPDKIKPINFKSEYEYIQRFKNIFNNAVHCRLRAEGNVGIMLSGGLDSTSVAAIAAIELKKNNMNLEAFTYLPIEDYESVLSDQQVANEREYVEELKRVYENINLNYCRCDGKNSLYNIDENIEILEQPYKTVENLYWIDEIFRLSKSKNCNVLLDGQFGNFTISNGSITSYIYTLIKKGRWISLFKEITGCSKLYQIGRKELVKEILKIVTKSACVSNNFFSGKNRDIQAPVNMTMSDKWRSMKRAQKLGYNAHPSKIYDFEETKRYVTNFVLFSHIGGIETKYSLSRGITKRDPTRDVRVVEYCLGLPDNQFVSNGRNRVLIRKAMEGVLPDKIRLNYFIRGKQSADWIQRVSPYWKSVSSEIKDIIQSEYMSEYLDVDKLKNILNNVGEELNKDVCEFDIKILFTALIFNRFMDKKLNVNQNGEGLVSF